MATSNDYAFINQGTGAAQTAIGRLIQAGSWDPGITNRDLRGVGGQRLIRKGTQKTMMTGVQVFSPNLTLMAKFLRTGKGIQVASFPDFTVGIDAGEGNEIEVWVLASCQPARIALSWAEGGEMVASFDVWSAAASQSNATSEHNVQAAATTIGHTDDELAVTLGLVGAPVDYEPVEGSFEVNNTPAWHNPQSGKEAGVKTRPNCVLLGNEEATARIVHTMPIPKTIIDATGDNWQTAEGARKYLEMIVTADNGIAAEDATFTLSKLMPNGSPRSAENSSGRSAIETSFVSETIAAAAAIT